MTEETLTSPSPAPVRSLPPRTRRFRTLLLILVVVVLLLCLLGYIGVLGGNVRTVDPGRVYRSSQLTGNGYEAISARMVGNSLDSVLSRLHIKTLINLRGGSMQDARYRDEVAICNANHVTHVDIPFSARRLPSPEVMQKMLATFDTARYPLLIHCQAGADRTGLACTVYADIYEHEPLDQAESTELTWRYGHISSSSAGAMNTFFDLYRQTSHGMSLRDWIDKKYPEVYKEHEGNSP